MCLGKMGSSVLRHMLVKYHKSIMELANLEQLTETGNNVLAIQVHMNFVPPKGTMSLQMTTPGGTIP